MPLQAKKKCYPQNNRNWTACYSREKLQQESEGHDGEDEGVQNCRHRTALVRVFSLLCLDVHQNRESKHIHNCCVNPNVANNVAGLWVDCGHQSGEADKDYDEEAGH